jgi:hypothetical protein
MQPKSAFGVRIRTQAMRLPPYLPQSLLMRGMRRIFNGVELPDYSHLLADRSV